MPDEIIVSIALRMPKGNDITTLAYLGPVLQDVIRIGGDVFVTVDPLPTLPEPNEN